MTGDHVPYEGFAWPQTHPDRLALMATLHGLEPAHPDRCRVLELGCGDGLNVVAMAAASAGVEVVGLDISDAGLARGRAYAQALELDSVRLEAADLRAVGPELGRFDYVVAHGVYTWVPADVREALMRIVAEVLAPHGVAYISYICLPAGHLRYLARDVALLPSRHGADAPLVKAAAARMILTGLTQRFEGRDDAYAIALRSEAERMLEQSDFTLLHDDLNTSYTAFWLGEVVEHAARHGLRLLCEADPDELRATWPAAELRSGFGAIARGDEALREQLVDMVIGRMFRRSVLVRADAAVSEPGPQALARLRLGAGRVRLDDWPGSAQEAFAAFMEGDLDLHAAPARHVEAAGERPEAFALARLQAADGPKLVSLDHGQLHIEDDFARALIRALDGRRDRDAIVAAVAGDLGGGEQLREEIRAGLEESLAALAGLALLKA